MKKAKRIDELRPEYNFSDFKTKGVRGKYYKRIMAEGANVVLLIKITARRQVTLPARVLESLSIKPGDWIELEEGPDGFVLRARRIDRARSAPLRGKLRRGKGSFNLEVFRRQVSTPKPD